MNKVHSNVCAPDRGGEMKYLVQRGYSSHHNPLPGSAGLLFGGQQQSSCLKATNKAEAKSIMNL